MRETAVKSPGKAGKSRQPPVNPGAVFGADDFHQQISLVIVSGAHYPI